MPRGGSQRAAQDAVVLRLVTLLRFLTQEARAVPTRRLRALSAEYRGDSGLPTFNRDLNELRQRGIVTITGSGGERLVRLSPLEKHRAWYLTTDEHVAMARARAVVRAAPTAAAPLDPGHHERLDLLLRVLRSVEERPHAPSINQLAFAFAVAPQQLFDLLDLVAEDPVARTGVPGLQLWLLDDDHQLAAGEQVAAIRVRLKRPDGQRPGLHPMVGRGLHLLGAFPYTAQEADDQLRIIDMAMSTAPSEPLEDLRSAQQKLGAWRDHLRTMSDSV